MIATNAARSTARVDGFRLPEHGSDVERATAVAQQLEKVFVQYLVQGLRGASLDGEGGGLFGDGPGASTYEDWFDQHMATQLTQGEGIGLARQLVQQWQRSGVLRDGGRDAQESFDARV